VDEQPNQVKEGPSDRCMPRADLLTSGVAWKFSPYAPKNFSSATGTTPRTGRQTKSWLTLEISYAIALHRRER
jgi:hypothetical protein